MDVDPTTAVRQAEVAAAKTMIARTDGTFSRADFAYDHAGDIYMYPSGKRLITTGTLVNDDATLVYRASKLDCAACALKPRCCPNAPARTVPRSIHGGGRDMARDIAKTDAYIISRRERKKVEMRFASLNRMTSLGMPVCLRVNLIADRTGKRLPYDIHAPLPCCSAG